MHNKLSVIIHDDVDNVYPAVVVGDLICFTRRGACWCTLNYENERLRRVKTSTQITRTDTRLKFSNVQNVRARKPFSNRTSTYSRCTKVGMSNVLKQCMFPRSTRWCFTSSKIHDHWQYNRSWTLISLMRIIELMIYIYLNGPLTYLSSPCALLYNVLNVHKF